MKGYAALQSEFDEAIRKILQLNYGLVLISHAKLESQGKAPNGDDLPARWIPTIGKTGRLICERTCDIIGFSSTVVDENGNQETKLFLRDTPEHTAGSRFKYLPDSIPFSYDALVNAIGDAIDKEAAENGNKFVTDKPTRVVTEEVTYDYDNLIKMFSEYTGDLMAKDPSNNTKIVAIVDKYLGKGKKVAKATPDQAEQIDLIVHDLKELLDKG